MFGSKKWLLLPALMLGALVWMGLDGGASQQISSDEAHALVKQGALLLDVRTGEEFKGGHLDGALNIPVQELDKRLGELTDRKSSEVVVYCRTGHRSAIARATLMKAGFTKVHDLGAIGNWR